MNKAEFIEFIKRQTGVELENDAACILNKKRKILYTQISRTNFYRVAPAMISKGIKYENHVKDYYFIFVA